MTTFAVAPTGSPDWRQIHPTPPNAQLYTVGPYCPLDNTVLQERADGFGCPVCSAAWDFHGLAGRWLAKPVVRRRPSAVVVLAGLAGCAVAAATLAAVLGELDQRLLWWLSAAIVAAAVVYVPAGWLSQQVGDWPYRHNRVIATYDSAAQALGSLEVSDEH